MTLLDKKIKIAEHILGAQEIVRDYRLAYQSRQVSLIGRREVMSGRAKFGVFGDGKELPQIALAKVFRKGDWRSGYYRDQTLMLALGGVTPQDFFAQLYAHTDVQADPMSGGRQLKQSAGAAGIWMVGFFAGSFISFTVAFLAAELTKIFIGFLIGVPAALIVGFGLGCALGGFVASTITVNTTRVSGH